MIDDRWQGYEWAYSTAYSMLLLQEALRRAAMTVDTWVRLGFHSLGDRRKVFRVWANEPEHDWVVRKISTCQGLEAQKVLTEEVVSVRPQLAGCVVLGYSYNLLARRLEVSVSHGSLPVVQAGCMAEAEEDLYAGADRVSLVSTNGGLR